MGLAQLECLVSRTTNQTRLKSLLMWVSVDTCLHRKTFQQHRSFTTSPEPVESTQEFCWLPYKKSRDLCRQEFLPLICIELQWAMAVRIVILVFVEKFGQVFSISFIKLLDNSSGTEIQTVHSHIFDLVDRYLFPTTLQLLETVASKPSH